MSKYVVFLYCITFGAPMILHQKVEVPLYSQDRNRVIITYNTSTDPCFKISTISTLEAKEAADSACADAFEALDRLEGNSCNGWRHPRCRQLLLPDFDYFQCSCRVPGYILYENRRQGVSTFRDCAWKLCAEELLDGHSPAPSVSFLYTQERILVDAVEKSRLRRMASTATEAGTSQVSVVPQPIGKFDDIVDAQVGSDSRVFVDSTRSGVVVYPAPAPVTNQGPHICFYCGRIYARKQILRDHEKSHLLDLRCMSCNTKYSTKANYNKHIRKYHKTQAGSTSANPGGKDEPKIQYSCDICGKKFLWKTSLAAHRKGHTEDISCDLCNTVYSTRANYRHHLRAVHPKIYEAQAARALAERHHECEICKERFVSKRMLQEHGPVHLGETVCKSCNMVFPRKSALRMHERKVHEKKT